jgi:endonuclease YncB( thermonuclease family)
MFGWRRKSDGFEWHKYVRTTIKLRRNDRRRRIDNLKQAAADKAQQAGAAGSSAGRAIVGWLGRTLAQCWSDTCRLTRRLPSALLTLLGMAAQWTRTALQSLLLLSTRLVTATVRLLSGGFQWTSRTLQRPGLSHMFAGAAIMAALFATFRVVTVSITDLQAIIIAGLSAGLGGLAFLSLRDRPSLRPSFQALPLRKIAGSVGGVIGAIGALPRPSARTAGLTAAGVAGVIVAGYTASMAWHATPTIGTLGSFRTITSAPSETLTGRARALSGDTLAISGRIVRLGGIEAPELAQTCRTGSGRAWQCGSASRRRLASLTGRKKVACEVRKSDTPRLHVGRCTIGGTDIAARMVTDGYAFAVGGVFRSTYGTEENTARSRKAGLWQGQAQRPEEFRNQRWAHAKEQAPRGCPIKGRIVRKGKVYVLPWSPDYRRVQVRSRRGERWFCSEEEAVAAGWQPGSAG